MACIGCDFAIAILGAVMCVHVRLCLQIYVRVCIKRYSHRGMLFSSWKFEPKGLWKICHCVGSVLCCQSAVSSFVCRQSCVTIGFCVVNTLFGLRENGRLLPSHISGAAPRDFLVLCIINMYWRGCSVKWWWSEVIGNFNTKSLHSPYRVVQCICPHLCHITPRSLVAGSDWDIVKVLRLFRFYCVTICVVWQCVCSLCHYAWAHRTALVYGFVLVERERRWQCFMLLLIHNGVRGNC